MDTKTFTCIECPLGCKLSVDIEGCKVVKVSGNQCPKGEKYAIAEIENPTRVLTTTILTEGLALRAVPVRTSGPVPKDKMMDIMTEIKKARLKKNVKAGDVVIKNILELNVNMIATRDADNA